MFSNGNEILFRTKLTFRKHERKIKKTVSPIWLILARHAPNTNRLGFLTLGLGVSWGLYLIMAHVSKLLTYNYCALKPKLISKPKVRKSKRFVFGACLVLAAVERLSSGLSVIVTIKTSINALAVADTYMRHELYYFKTDTSNRKTCSSEIRWPRNKHQIGEACDTIIS